MAYYVIWLRMAQNTLKTDLGSLKNIKCRRYWRYWILFFGHLNNPITTPFLPKNMWRKEKYIFCWRIPFSSVSLTCSVTAMDMAGTEDTELDMVMRGPIMFLTARFVSNNDDDHHNHYDHLMLTKKTMMRNDTLPPANLHSLPLLAGLTTWKGQGPDIVYDHHNDDDD